MPEAWSAKDERQYEHVKQSEKQRGANNDRAEEIAARTVNKERREEGRTANRRTTGTGNPRAPLEERTRDELYNLAEQSDIRGRSRMNKTQLITAIRRSRGPEV
ncbi:MAG TPA: Rho termination factor N-terminal domain-containing protein [Dehalococcoidia bacterium]|nr:Rho termination factor N-terminal domain-containing protein [Dehalococcoidia bacterium]